MDSAKPISAQRHLMRIIREFETSVIARQDHETLFSILSSLLVDGKYLIRDEDLIRAEVASGIYLDRITWELSQLRLNDHYGCLAHCFPNLTD